MLLGRFTLDSSKTAELVQSWQTFIETKDEKGKGPTRKMMNSFLSDGGCVEGTLVEIGGEPFKIFRPADCSDELETHTNSLLHVASAVGLAAPEIHVQDDEE